MQKGSVIEYRQKDGDVVYRVQFRDAAGRQLKETIGRKSEGWTKRKVQAELSERIARVAKKGYRRPDPVLFSAYADAWFEEAQVRKAWSKATVSKYDKAIRRLKERFPGKLTEIRKPAVNAYGSELLRKGLSASTVNLELTVLYGILEAAKEDGLTDENPAAKARRPAIPAYKPRSLKPEELRRVEAELRNEPQVHLAFLTFGILGLRWSELQSLRWRDVDFLGKRLRVEESKTEEGERSVGIPSGLLARFEEHFQRTHYRHESDYIFCHPEKGSQWDWRRYAEPVKAALKRADIEDRFRVAHDLRVTSLTTGALNGESPVVLMARAGHRSFETTKRYLSLAGVVFHKEAEAVERYLLGTPAGETEGRA